MRWRAFAAVIGTGIALDQALKYLVETGLDMHEKVDVLPFLALYRIHNTGIAFSMFSALDQMALVAMACVVIAFVLWLATRLDPAQGLARLGFALVLSGAISNNLIDRLFLGHVIDYVLFHTPVWSFAIFNLADTFISVGAGLVILDELIAWRRHRRESAKGPRPPRS